MWDTHGVFELSAGQIVADKYRIDGIMAAGGMGVVVAATHLELDQKVAIKFLREISTEALARFQREARLLVRLKSAHVARVFDVGALDDDTPFIVMEHLDGSDLATIASERGKLPVEETVDYLVQAMEAVAEAHALGMVHRDLKPANLFLARGPGGTTTVKVLDFGVSKILDDRSIGDNEPPRGGDLTHEGVALGSPGYMSPEQMTSARDVDERSDIFSFGALLYRLVAGQPPYRGASVVSILASMATEPLKPLRSIVPDVPEPFGAIVERCLAHDKAARFPTVAHLAHALTPYATRRGRVSIEQIMATLNVTFPDDAAEAIDTISHPLVAPAAASSRPRPKLPGMPPAPLLGPPASAPPMAAFGIGSDEPHETGPHFTISAPMATPPTFVRAGPESARSTMPQAITIGTMMAALLIFGAAVVWRAFGPKASGGVTDPASPATEVGAAWSEPSPAASGVATASPSVGVTPDAPPAATGGASAATDPAGARPRPSATTRPRPHPSAAHGPTRRDD